LTLQASYIEWRVTGAPSLFDCIVSKDATSYVKLWLEVGQKEIQVPLSGKGTDFQYMKAVNGVVSKQLWGRRRHSLCF